MSDFDVLKAKAGSIEADSLVEVLFRGSRGEILRKYVPANVIAATDGGGNGNNDASDVSVELTTGSSTTNFDPNAYPGARKINLSITTGGTKGPEVLNVLPLTTNGDDVNNAENGLLIIGSLDGLTNGSDAVRVTYDGSQLLITTLDGSNGGATPFALLDYQGASVMLRWASYQFFLDNSGYNNDSDISDIPLRLRAPSEFESGYVAHYGAGTPTATFSGDAGAQTYKYVDLSQVGAQGLGPGFRMEVLESDGSGTEKICTFPSTSAIDFLGFNHLIVFIEKPNVADTIRILTTLIKNTDGSDLTDIVLTNINDYIFLENMDGTSTWHVVRATPGVCSPEVIPSTSTDKIAKSDWYKYVNLQSAGLSGAYTVHGSPFIKINLDGNNYTSFSAIDVSTLTELRLGNVSALLTDINLNGCSGLIPSLDALLATFSAVETLDIGFIGTASVDLTACAALTTLYSHYNNLSAIDLSGNTSLSIVGLNNNSLTSFDASALVDLTTLYLNNNSLLAITIANPLVSWLVASGNALDEASVDGVLVQLVANGLSSGHVDLSGGTNSPPSATGLAAKATLEGLGWTVTVN